MPNSHTLKNHVAVSISSKHGCERSLLINQTQQLLLQNIFPFLILLRRLVGLVVLPPHNNPTRTTRNVAHDMAACGHVAFDGVSFRDVDDSFE